MGQCQTLGFRASLTTPTHHEDALEPQKSHYQREILCVLQEVESCYLLPSVPFLSQTLTVVASVQRGHRVSWGLRSSPIPSHFLPENTLWSKWPSSKQPAFSLSYLRPDKTYNQAASASIEAWTAHSRLLCSNLHSLTGLPLNLFVNIFLYSTPAFPHLSQCCFVCSIFHLEKLRISLFWQHSAWVHEC